MERRSEGRPLRRPEESERGVVASVEVARMRRLVRQLPPAERKTIFWLYGLEGLTLSRTEVARRLRVDVARVRRLERQGLSRIARHQRRSTRWAA